MYTHVGGLWKCTYAYTDMQAGLISYGLYSHIYICSMYFIYRLHSGIQHTWLLGLNGGELDSQSLGGIH